MKKRATVLATVFALASMIGMALPAAAADLHTPQQGTECYGATCVWHLVNVQAGDGPHDTTLDSVNLANANVTNVVVKDLKHVVHFWVTTQRISSGSPQTLNFLSTTNSGKIVISDYYCTCGCPCGG